MTTKQQVAEEFFTRMENVDELVQTVGDRMGEETLQIIRDYAKGMATINRGNLDLSDENFISSVMIYGFLLKSQLDRYELETSLNEKVY